MESTGNIAKAITLLLTSLWCSVALKHISLFDELGPDSRVRSLFQHHLNEEVADPINFLEYRGQKLAVIMYATHANKGLCSTLNTALSRGWPVNVLGPTRSDSNNPKKYSKIFFFYEAAKRLPRNAIVLFVDAYDVLFQGSPRHFISSFVRLEQKKCVGVDCIFYGAESNCWPFTYPPHRAEYVKTCQYWGISVDEVCDAQHPEAKSKWRYINSGMSASRARVALDHYVTALREVDQDPSQWCTTDDQALVAWLIIGRKGPKVVVDSAVQLFGNVHESSGSYSYNLNRTMWKNSDIKSSLGPFLLHFNGEGKLHMLRFLEKVGDTNVKMPEAMLAVDGERKKLGEICKKRSVPLSPFTFSGDPNAWIVSKPEE